MSSSVEPTTSITPQQPDKDSAIKPSLEEIKALKLKYAQPGNPIIRKATILRENGDIDYIGSGLPLDSEQEMAKLKGAGLKGGGRPLGITGEEIVQTIVNSEKNQ